MDSYVNIHTHRPTGCGIELRTAGVHPWYADRESVASILPQLETAQAVGETGLDALRGRASSWRWPAGGGCPSCCTACGRSRS